MRNLLLLVLLLTPFIPVCGQTTITGRVAVATSGTIAAIPCNPGDLAVTTDTFQVYECGPANTWVVNSSNFVFNGAPTGPCLPNQTAVDTTTGNFYNCHSGTWNFVGPGSGSVAWASLVSGTNTTSTFFIGTGASLGPSGSGVITASTMPFSGLTGFPAGCSTGTYITTLSLTPTCGSVAYSAVTGTPTLYYQLTGVGGVSDTARNRLNLIAGSNVTIGAVDNSGTNSTDITITATSPSAYYQLVGANGTSQTPRNRINLIGGANMTVSAADNSGTNSTDITLTPSTSYPALTVGSLNNVLYVDNSHYTTLAAAFAGCPSSGCTIDMRGDANPTALTLSSSTPFDPGTTPLTILLGPYSYTGAFTLRNGLSIYGTSRNSTILTQPSASVPPIALPTTGTTNIVAQNVNIGHLSLEGAAGSSTSGLSLIAAVGSGSGGGGIWYSNFFDLKIGDITPFGVNNIRIDLTHADGPAANQFLSFRDIIANRAKNNPPALNITGPYSGQFSFDNCEFDANINAQDTTANLANINIDDTPGPGAETWVPYSIAMNNVTSQWANGPGGVAIHLQGVQGFTCINCHFEGDMGILKMNLGPGGHGNFGVGIQNSYIVTSSQAALWGQSAGSGYVINSDASSTADFDDNSFDGTPDNWFTGTYYYVSAKGTMNSGNGAPQPAPVNNRPIYGFDPDSPAIKHVRVNTGNISGGTRLNQQVSWTSAFPDDNYSVTCSVIDATTPPTSAGLVFERLNGSPSPGSIFVTISNPTGGTLVGTVECIAIHD